MNARKTKVEFTQDDVRLVRLIGDLWDQGSERLAQVYGRPDFQRKDADSAKLSHFPRIANAIEAEITGQPLPTKDPLAGLRPGDGGLVKASAPLARNPAEEAAMRDLAKRLAAHIPKKLVFKNPDGSSVTITATTMAFKERKRGRRK